MKAQEIIDVVQAAEEGKIIQESSDTKDWVDMDLRYEAFIIFGESRYKYRVKPDPREFYVNIYSDNDNCIHPSLELAKNACYGASDFVQTIKVKEVL